MATNEKITTRRERVNAILDTLGGFLETEDFTIHDYRASDGAEVQLYGCLSALAGAFRAEVKSRTTDYGTIQREAVIDGVTYTEVEILPRKRMTCPVCGEECGRVFYSERGVAVGCDVCLTEVSEYDGAESAGESPNAPPQA